MPSGSCVDVTEDMDMCCSTIRTIRLGYMSLLLFSSAVFDAVNEGAVPVIAVVAPAVRREGMCCSSGYSSCSLSESLRPRYANARRPKERASRVFGERTEPTCHVESS